MSKYKKLKNSTSHILVIGDVMIDEYYRGYVNRVSPESPVPVFNYKDSYYRLGGAANVAANVATLASRVSLMTVIGKDYYGEKFRVLLKTAKVDDRFIIEDKSRQTTVKTRLLAQNNQQMMRIDREDSQDISLRIQDALLESLESHIEQFDIVLVSDYLKGLLTKYFLQKVIHICNQNKKKVIIDIKGEDLSKYKDAYLLKPNNKELGDILKSKISNDKELIEAAKRLKAKANVEAVLVTCGEKGMILITEDDDVKHIKTIAKEVFDVTGAGDTVLSYLGCSIVSGLSLYDSAKLSNVAAGIKVGKVGTSVIRLAEIEQYYKDNSPNIKKVVSAEEYVGIKSDYINKKVVFTNGCFDILHVGHVRYLKQAAELGDILIVGVNSDQSVQRLKGEQRPIVCEKERVEMLSDLSFIDYLIIFDEDTPYELIKSIQPDLLVKGGDYKKNDVVGRDIVEKNGGEVILLPLVEGASTTNIVEKILSIHEKGGN